MSRRARWIAGGAPGVPFGCPCCCRGRGRQGLRVARGSEGSACAITAASLFRICGVGERRAGVVPALPGDRFRTDAVTVAVQLPGSVIAGAGCAASFGHPWRLWAGLVPGGPLGARSGIPGTSQRHPRGHWAAPAAGDLAGGTHCQPQSRSPRDTGPLIGTSSLPGLWCPTRGLAFFRICLVATKRVARITHGDRDQRSNGGNLTQKLCSRWSTRHVW